MVSWSSETKQCSWETRRSCSCAKGRGSDGSAIRKLCMLDGNERRFTTVGEGVGGIPDGLNRELCGFQIWSRHGGEERNLCSVVNQIRFNQPVASHWTD